MYVSYGTIVKSVGKNFAACSCTASARRPGGVTEHEALVVFEPGGLDLIPDVRERVGPPKGEVLQPRDQFGLLSSHRGPEIAKRIGHGRARARVRIDDVVLARHVVGGVDHRGDRVDG